MMSKLTLEQEYLLDQIRVYGYFGLGVVIASVIGLVVIFPLMLILCFW